MVEQTLEIQENTVGDKVYKNINLKPKAHKGIKGIDDGNYIVIEKKFADGIEKTATSAQGQSYKYYIVLCKYLDEDVSFFLTEKEHGRFSEAGGEGDKVKITLTKETIVNKKTGIESLIPVLNFEVA